jgi:hypothetical protein
MFFQKQQDMFTNADINQHTFFAAKDTPNGKKTFTSFHSLQDFLVYYESIPTQDRHFYEMVRKDFPFYEYYDLDISLSPSSDRSLYNNEVLFEWFDTIRANFLRLNAPIDSPLLKPKWIITTASDHTKLSLHLVNTNAIFTSTDVFKQYYRQFKQHYDSFCSTHPFTVDWCVSSNNRMMRVIDSTKIGSNRALRIWSSFHDEKISSRQTFITNASNDNDLFHKWVTVDMFTTSTTSPKPKPKEKKNAPTVIEHTNDGLGELLRLLHPSRYDSYQDWITVGMALKNNDEENKDLFLQWSSQSPKYDKDGCEKTWDGFRTDVLTPVTLGTVHFFAKTDNPSGYSEFVEKHKKVSVNLPFTPHVSIKHKFIPQSFYLDHFAKGANVIALKSNMNTGKTHGMPSLFDTHQKIIVVYQRVSLNLSIHEKWKRYGFELYSDIEDYIIRTDVHHRIIVQVDSLHRLRGKCDLLILDEIESVHEHLCGSRMNDNVAECWRTLSNYIRHSRNIIACDANLKDETCQLLFSNYNNNTNKIVTKIENTYKSFTGLKCKMLISPEKVVEKVFELLDNGKNVVIPTNSKSRAKRMEKLIIKRYRNDRNISVLRIDSENGFTKKEEWNKYNVLIYTPTVTAGVSFEDSHFHALCGFFGRNSTSSEQSSQMLFRVRNLIDNEMYLYAAGNCDSSKPIDDISLTQYIQNMIRVSHQSLRTEGIEIDRYNEKAKENTYFKLYRLYLKKSHLSFTYFRSYLSNILKDHGINITYDTTPITDKELKDDMKDVIGCIKKEDAESIVNATPINGEQYSKLIETRNEKTKDELLSMKRYVLTNTFDKKYDDPLDLIWVQTNIRYLGYRHFKTYSTMTKDMALETCQDMIERTAKQKMAENTKKRRMLRPEGDDGFTTSDSEGSDVESPYRRKQIKKNIHIHLHSDKTYHKLYHCLQFVFRAGFSSLGDTGKVKIDYNALHNYCKENEETMRVVFGSKMMNWKDELDGNEKMSISQFINQKLESCLGVRLTPVYKGSLTYQINRLFVF